VQKDGWGKLHIETNSQYADEVQMHAAGYVEGYLTADRIYQQYINIYSVFWKNSSNPIPAVVLKWLDNQDTWVRYQAKKNKAQDNYWGQVANVLAQFDGLVAGYNDYMAMNDPSKKLTSLAFSILNGVGDLLDVTAAFSAERPKNYDDWSYSKLKSWIYNSHCSGFVKVTGDLSDLYAGHTAWFAYQATIRISKYYNFPLSNPTTASQMVTFSSYPGFLESLDDFYITTQRLVVMETTNSIFNDSLYSFVRSNPNVILSWQRTLVANRMAHSGMEWSKIYSMHNSGTYNNQWIVVDMKNFKPYSKVDFGTLTILEQIPGHTEYADQSAILEKGYWASYNVPFYPYIFKISGYTEMSKRQPIMLSYDTCCRANIFRRDQGNVKDESSFKHLMRYNDWQHDPYSQGNPGYSISSRFDLEATSDGPQAFGGYDNKMTSYYMAPSYVWNGLSGPTDQQNPPFSWNERNGMFSNYSHVGLPDTYAFDYVVMKPKYFL
jgi:hypothetical protein